MINWSIQVLPIKSLKEHPKNPRQIKKEMMISLDSNIKKFGLIEKPIINKDLTIIGGHQRIKILKKMKANTVECWMPDRMLNQEEVDELCISLNLHKGEWDYDCLANEWNELDLLNWGFSEDQLLGFSKDTTEVLEKEPKEKNKKCCPNCGHEF